MLCLFMDWLLWLIPWLLVIFLSRVTDLQAPENKGWNEEPLEEELHVSVLSVSAKSALKTGVVQCFVANEILASNFRINAMSSVWFSE